MPQIIFRIENVWTISKIKQNIFLTSGKRKKEEKIKPKKIKRNYPDIVVIQNKPRHHHPNGLLINVFLSLYVLFSHIGRVP